jgi:hypothetical protein
MLLDTYNAAERGRAGRHKFSAHERREILERLGLSNDGQDNVGSSAIEVLERV